MLHILLVVLLFKYSNSYKSYQILKFIMAGLESIFLSVHRTTMQSELGSAIILRWILLATGCASVIVYRLSCWWLIDCLIDWLISWLVDWLIDWLVGWLIPSFLTVGPLPWNCFRSGGITGLRSNMHLYLCLLQNGRGDLRFPPPVLLLLPDSRSPLTDTPKTRNRHRIWVLVISLCPERVETSDNTGVIQW